MQSGRVCTATSPARAADALFGHAATPTDRDCHFSFLFTSGLSWTVLPRGVAPRGELALPEKAGWLFADLRLPSCGDNRSCPRVWFFIETKLLSVIPPYSAVTPVMIGL